MPNRSRCSVVKIPIPAAAVVSAQHDDGSFKLNSDTIAKSCLKIICFDSGLFEFFSYTKTLKNFSNQKFMSAHKNSKIWIFKNLQHYDTPQQYALNLDKFKFDLHLHQAHDTHQIYFHTATYPIKIHQIFPRAIDFDQLSLYSLMLIQLFVLHNLTNLLV